MSENVPSNLPEVQAIYRRDFDRWPRIEGLIEIDRAIMFGDGDVMLFGSNDQGHPIPGIRLTRDCVWALKARA